MQMLTFHTAATSRLAYLRECFSYDNSFIHSGYFYSASSSPLLLRSASDTAWMSEFLAESPQPTASEGLSKGPYMVARAGSEPITLTKGDESTNEPPRPEVCSRQVY